MNPMSVPYAARAEAKIRGVLDANKSSTPVGAGDMEWVYDTHVFRLPLASGTGWVYDDYAMDNIGSLLDQEAVEDIVGSLIVAGSDINVTYADGAGTLTIAWTGTTLTQENVEDYVAAMLQEGDNITLAYNDETGELTISASTGSGGGGAGDYTYKGCSLYRPSSAQTLTASTETNLQFNAEYFDDDGMHNPVTNSHRIENFSNGEVYLFTANVVIGGGAAGGGACAVRMKHYDSSLTTTNTIVNHTISSDEILNGTGGVSISQQIAVDSGDYVYLTFDNQDSNDLELDYIESTFGCHRVKA